MAHHVRTPGSMRSMLVLGVLFVLLGCGADRRAGQRARGSTATSPTTTETTSSEIADERAWMRDVTAENAGASPSVLPATFFAEDPRYRELVADGAIGAFAESWSIEGTSLEHRYEVSFESSAR